MDREDRSYTKEDHDEVRVGARVSHDHSCYP